MGHNRLFTSQNMMTFCMYQKLTFYQKFRLQISAELGVFVKLLMKSLTFYRKKQL